MFCFPTINHPANYCPPPLPPRSVYNSSKSVHIRSNDSNQFYFWTILKNHITCTILLNSSKKLSKIVIELYENNTFKHKSNKYNLNYVENNQKKCQANSCTTIVEVLFLKMKHPPINICNFNWIFFCLLLSIHFIECSPPTSRLGLIQ